MEQLNLHDIGADLAEEANQYFASTNDLPDITGPELATQLDKMLETETIELFLQNGDLGRGILMGIAIGVFTLELAVDIQLAARTDEADGDEDAVPDDEIEEIILNGLKKGIRDGGGPDDGETIQ